MLFKKARWGVVMGLAAALIATPALAIDSTKLQSIRSSLSVEEIVAFAMAKSTAPILDIDKTIEMNIILNAKGMERSDVQDLQLEFLRVFFGLMAYTDVRLNFDASHSIDYSVGSPYTPFGNQNQPSNTQTVEVFVDRDALKLAKLGQIAVHDIDTLRSKPDSLECYHERRKGYPVINVIVDRDINPVGCLYTVLLQSIGLEGPFGGVAATYRAGDVPGFRRNGEMAAAYAIHECRSLIGGKDPFEKCLRDVLDAGKW
ncbi:MULTISPECIES: hypothetical protein [Rhizobium]|uniref:hypothetical protein n=1 Tax=Rhizobium TaxID=379 RepID=UPI001B339CAA|nr:MULTISPECIES: hypothetical protein [Rhizobium]MBX4909215.1 hypothetical protein [Rhizobium bangladeshense]MBX5214857.1 hypothetical protein [Rhizobium sp. NLR9a]MBX5232021.1 hypothetical protein [Rhizobium sp. NLR4a]MBX5244272.1 hypothetical protein [Rhizobium sp. NLR3b]MBX5249636.1 hypothetical protein [Rhizobium sp. NLR4b]